MSTAIQIAGRSKLYLGLPDAPSTLVELGEQLDDTRIEIQNFTTDVYGDSHGGPQGPPIEKQILGQIARVNFNLSKWSQVLREELEQHAAFAAHGTIAAEEIGALMLIDKSFRVTVVPSRQNNAPGDAYDYFAFNFPCSIVSSPIVIGQGTKHSLMQFSIEAHRVPAGHSQAGTKLGVIWDRDITGIPA